MKPNVTPVERAFQLARSGEMHSVEEIKRALATEGYSANQITGRTLAVQLRALIDTAQVKD